MLPLADTARQKRPPAMTALLVAANLAVFGWQVALALNGGERPLAVFVTEHALVARRFLAHLADARQWFTLITHMFIHGSVAHVLGNVWFLWIFGGNVEDRLGSFRFLLFYLGTGVAAAALQVFVDPASSIRRRRSRCSEPAVRSPACSGPT
jgi:membrane associated rhomboid family serine protease